MMIVLVNIIAFAGGCNADRKLRVRTALDNIQSALIFAIDVVDFADCTDVKCEDHKTDEPTIE